MPKLFQINIVSNRLSTGKICEDIAKVAVKHGWETYMAYGRLAKESVSEQRRVGNTFDMYEHYAEHRIFDMEGLASRNATKKLIQWIDDVEPDIIQLHNIHDHYLNYPILFKYLATLDTPVVWTQHDCWSFTGGCVYCDLYKCEKWRKRCKGSCPNRRAIFCNKSEKQYQLKEEIIGSVKNLTFVPVSDWLGALLKDSMHSNKRIITIHNGINVQQFKPFSNSIDDTNHKFRILGVAAVWDKRKGLDDFLKLRGMLNKDDYEITIIGLKKKQIDSLPDGINGITRTSNIEELVKFYSDTNIFVNPTYSDNFPTVNLEALACGTPVITYKTGGSPEAIASTKVRGEKLEMSENTVRYPTGMVVPQGNVAALANAIMWMKDNPLSREECRKRAEQYFDKDKCFEKYIELYNELLGK